MICKRCTSLQTNVFGYDWRILDLLAVLSEKTQFAFWNYFNHGFHHWFPPDLYVPNLFGQDMLLPMPAPLETWPKSVGSFKAHRDKNYGFQRNSLTQISNFFHFQLTQPCRRIFQRLKPWPRSALCGLLPHFFRDFVSQFAWNLWVTILEQNQLAIRCLLLQNLCASSWKF